MCFVCQVDFHVCIHLRITMPYPHPTHTTHTPVSNLYTLISCTLHTSYHPLLPHSSYPPLLLSPSAFLSPSPFSSLSPSLFSFSLLPPLLPLLLPPLSLTLQPQVLSSHLLPTQREVDEVFRRNFLEAGGLKSVINVLQRNALPSDVDLTIRQDCYAIALSLAR